MTASSLSDVTGAYAAPRAKSATFRARKIHRWLGLIIGIQFILWTVGGLYFSWTDLDEIHGDHLAKAPPYVDPELTLSSPADALAALKARARVDSLAGIDLGVVLERPLWRITYFTEDGGRPVRRVQLADARTGALRGPLTRDEAVAAATAAYVGTAPVTTVEYLTPGNVGRHHEYREQPLPAWAVHFGDEEGATAYVAAELGDVVRIRNDQWRVFDFLWMLHTMDYQGRDNFNNLALRAFSLFGLATVMSGFVLFTLTSRWARRRGLRRAGGGSSAAVD